VPPEHKWKELVRLYLSSEHCDHPDAGCPVAALAPEIARAKLSIRKRIAGLMKEWVDIMPGATAREREQSLFVIYSAMAGAISIARVLTKPDDKQKLLSSVRDHLLRSF